MTDNEKRAHDLAIVVTEMYIENDLQVSRAKSATSGRGTANTKGVTNVKALSSSLLAESFILRYNIVYQQLLEVFNNSDLEID